MPAGFFSIFVVVVSWALGVAAFVTLVGYCFHESQKTYPRNGERYYTHKASVRFRFTVAAWAILLVGAAFILSALIAVNQ